ncbi:MAG: hypothetical protein IJE96_06030, partial [Mailhella sp.]|nr:hypothetical protein [Mailhella sp.]
MLTKGAIGNLVNRYKAVLAKCNLINTFGSLAVAAMLVMGGASVASAALIDVITQAGTAEKTITLTEDETLSSSLKFAGKNIVLDLNGKAITSSGDDAFYLKAPNGFTDNTLTITDSSASMSGSISSTSGDCAVFMSGNNTLKIMGGTLKNSQADATHNYTTVQTNGNPDEFGVTIEVSGGKIISETLHAMYLPHVKNLSITGGHIEGHSAAVEIRGGTANISGGTFISRKDTFSCRGYGNGGTLTGVAFGVSQHTDGNKKPYDLTVNISGGTFTGEYAFYEGYFAQAEQTTPQVENNNADSLTLSITGGTFNGKIFSGSKTDFIYGGTFSDETALTYLAPNANITVTDKDIASYANESGDNHTINFGAEGGSNVAKVELAENSTTTFDGKAAIEEMEAGANTTLNINSADITAKTSDLSNTAVTATGDVNDAVGGAEGLANQLGTTVNGIKSLNMEEGLISGAVVNGVQKTNTVMQDTLDMATAAPLAISRIVMNDVRKRMGDLRS